MKAIIPAAGMGTRFLPVTKCIPKELLPVLGKPTIQYVVEEALELDEVDGVIVITSKAKPQIEEFFSASPGLVSDLRLKGKASLADEVEVATSLPVTFVNQDEPRGLGHAVLCARGKVGPEHFLVLLGDYFVPERKMIPRMLKVSREHGGASVVAVARCAEEDVSRYGIVSGERVGSVGDADVADDGIGAVWRLDGLVEKPEPESASSRLYIVGRYLLSPRVMYILARQGPGAGGEIQLTDALVRLLDEEEIYALVVDPMEGCDTGTPASWAGTNARMALAAGGDVAREFGEALGESLPGQNCSR